MKKNETDEIFNAIRNQDVEKFKLLCKVSNMNCVNVLGQSFLHIAISSKVPEILDILMQLGISLKILDNNGKSALHYAATHQDLVSTNILIDLVDKNAIDKNGNTALFDAYVSSKKDWNLVKKMIALGCDPYVENKFGNSVAKIVNESRNKVVLDTIQEFYDESL
ncbi:ankyrin repeat domain-containing protein [Rahnella sp. PCH160]|uniref:ankyrin repeat domain-containing protein n=1 Tax=Rahnella sp. PCH160 TaxID=3447928 RepID=UPI0039FC34D0